MAVLTGQFVLSSSGVNEGTAIGPATEIATFTDDNTGDLPPDLSATIDWGDGTVTPNATIVGAMATSPSTAAIPMSTRAITPRP